MPENDLTDKIAIITGGGSGIGLRIGTAFAKAGAHIVVASRNKENLDKAAEGIKALGRESIAVATDVCIPDQVDELIKQTMDRFGRIDILVNNSGAAITFKPIEVMTPEEWNATIALNLTGPFLTCKAAGKVMIEQQSGKIINISSAAGLKGVSFMAHYSAAKSGLIRLTEALASGWAKHNINANCIAPGLTASEAEIERGSIPPDTRKDGTPVPKLLYPPAPENTRPAPQAARKADRPYLPSAALHAHRE